MWCQSRSPACPSGPPEQKRLSYRSVATLTLVKSSRRLRPNDAYFVDVRFRESLQERRGALGYRPVVDRLQPLGA